VGNLQNVRGGGVSNANSPQPNDGRRSDPDGTRLRHLRMADHSRRFARGCPVKRFLWLLWGSTLFWSAPVVGGLVLTAGCVGLIKFAYDRSGGDPALAFAIIAGFVFLFVVFGTSIVMWVKERK
jgi:hypothetical protein